MFDVCTLLGLMDNAGDDSDDDVDEFSHDQRGLQRPLHARQRPPGPLLSSWLNFTLLDSSTARTYLEMYVCSVL